MGRYSMSQNYVLFINNELFREVSWTRIYQLKKERGKNPYLTILPYTLLLGQNRENRTTERTKDDKRRRKEENGGIVSSLARRSNDFKRNPRSTFLHFRLSICLFIRLFLACHLELLSHVCVIRYRYVVIGV